MALAAGDSEALGCEGGERGRGREEGKGRGEGKREGKGEVKGRGRGRAAGFCVNSSEVLYTILVIPTPGIFVPRNTALIMSHQVGLGPQPARNPDRARVGQRAFCFAATPRHASPRPRDGLEGKGPGQEST